MKTKVYVKTALISQSFRNFPPPAWIFTLNIKVMIGSIIAASVIIAGFIAIVYDTYTEIKAEKNK